MSHTHPAEGIISPYLDAIILALFFLISFILYLVLVKLSKNSKSLADDYTPKVDEFEARYGYSYDYVFIFKVYDEEEVENLNDYQVKYSLKRFIDRCISAQIETKCFYSCQRDEIYVKVRAVPARLLLEADRIDYKLLLDPTNLKIAAKAGYMSKYSSKYVWQPITITDELNLCQYDAFDFIYARYDTSPRLQYLYTQYPANPAAEKPVPQALRPVDRIKLLLSVFEASTSDNPPGCGLEMSMLVANEAVLAHYPLHHFGQLKILENAWIKSFDRVGDIPLNEIKDYFGERIGLYFAFMQFYYDKLFIPAIIGIFVFAYRTYQRTEESLLLPYFAGILSIWSTILVEFWKRREITFAMKWGTHGFEEEEEDRAEFEGVDTQSPIDGSEMVYFPDRDRIYVRFLTFVVIVCFICLTLVMVVGLSFLQYFFSTNNQAFVYLSIASYNCSAYIVGVAAVTIIFILNSIFGGIAVQLNDYENHRTDTEYEDSLVWKVFIFQFFNSYSYVTHVAFVKTFIPLSCVNNSCYFELFQLLMVLTIIPVFAQFVDEVIVKKSRQQAKFAEETSGIEPGTVVGIVEKQYILTEYDVTLGSIADYSSVIVQFGYSAMFATVFPAGPMIVLVSTILRMKIDGWKLCQTVRRPLPKTAEDIGVWCTVIQVLSVISPLYVYGLIFFTSRYLSDTTLANRWIYLILVEFFVICLKYLISTVIDDVPRDVQMQLERQDFLVSKVIDNAEDTFEENFQISADANANIHVLVTDNDWDYPDLGLDDDEDEEGRDNNKEEKKESNGQSSTNDNEKSKKKKKRKLHLTEVELREIYKDVDHKDLELLDESQSVKLTF